MRRPGWRDAAWGAASLGLLLAAWLALSVVTDRSRPGLVPPPQVVLGTFWDLTIRPFAGLVLPEHVLSSLGRWGLGFGVALVLGIPLGILFGAVPVVRSAVSPIFELLRYIPPFAWIPLAVLWLGTGPASQSLVVFIAAFPAIVINGEIGARNVDPALVRASRVLGAGPVRRLALVIAPVAQPAIFAGARIAASNGWMALIASELIAGRTGVGFLIAQGQDNGEISVVMAGMAAIGLTAAMLDAGVIRIGAHLTRWRRTAGA